MPRLTLNIPIPCETAATADACSTEWSEIDLGLREHLPGGYAHCWERATPVALMRCRAVREDAQLELRAPSKIMIRTKRNLF